MTYYLFGFIKSHISYQFIYYLKDYKYGNINIAGPHDCLRAVRGISFVLYTTIIVNLQFRNDQQKVLQFCIANTNFQRSPFPIHIANRKTRCCV